MASESGIGGETTVHYEQLEDMEDEFDQVELEILRIQDGKLRGLYAKRDRLISQIPNFWPLVFEHAPPEIDEYIQPTDAAVLSSLKNLTVERFELPDGHPRSIAIRFEFFDNVYFNDRILEKKFWWRFAKDGWHGLVSEPVKINWKPGKDLTNGLLDLAKQIFDDNKAGRSGELTPAKKALSEKIESTSLDAASFFNFFGFRGRDITEQHSVEAAAAVEEKRKARREGREIDDEMGPDDDDDDDNDEYEYEIFPNADDIALTIAEDLWPDAIRYFTEGEELAALSDMESDLGNEDEEMTNGE